MSIKPASEGSVSITIVIDPETAAASQNSPAALRQQRTAREEGFSLPPSKKERLAPAKAESSEVKSPPMTPKRAAELIRKNFDTLESLGPNGNGTDRGGAFNLGDGLIGKKELENAANNPALSKELREACSFMAKNDFHRNRIDGAADNGRIDGVFAKADLDGYIATVPESSKSKDGMTPKRAAELVKQHFSTLEALGQDGKGGGRGDRDIGALAFVPIVGLFAAIDAKGKGDGLIGEPELRNAAQNEALDPELRRACKYFADSKFYRDALDGAADNGNIDGKIAVGDLDSFIASVPDENATELTEELGAFGGKGVTADSGVAVRSLDGDEEHCCDVEETTSGSGAHSAADGSLRAALGTLQRYMESQITAENPTGDRLDEAGLRKLAQSGGAVGEAAARVLDSGVFSKLDQRQNPQGAPDGLVGAGDIAAALSGAAQPSRGRPAALTAGAGLASEGATSSTSSSAKPKSSEATEAAQISELAKSMPPDQVLVRLRDDFDKVKDPTSGYITFASLDAAASNKALSPALRAACQRLSTDSDLFNRADNAGDFWNKSDKLIDKHDLEAATTDKPGARVLDTLFPWLPGIGKTV